MTKPSLTSKALLLTSLSASIHAQSISLEECPPSQSWSYTLRTDDYPWETSWRLDRIVDNGSNNSSVNNNNSKKEFTASGPSDGTYNRRSTYTNSLCLQPGNYMLTLNDAMGDGFCCNYGRGRWTMTLGGEENVVGRVMGADKFRTLEMQFVVNGSNDGSGNNGNGGGFEWQAPVDETTVKPTAVETSTAATTAVAVEAGTTSTIISSTTQISTTTTPQITTSTVVVTTEEPTAEEATTTQIAISIEAEATTSSSSNNNDNSQATEDQGTMPPSSSPTSLQELWANYKLSHSKFCGPKVVGGYATAIAQCGPLTVCGLKTSSDHYGSNGNDCPKGLMCYSDITCEATPPNGLFDSRISNLDVGNSNDEDGNAIDGRTNGSAKSIEVSLKQDLEVSRIEESGEFEVDASSMLESSGNRSSGSRFMFGCLMSVAAAAAAAGLLLM